MADFWAVGLASVQTKHIFTGRLGWIEGDSNNIYYNALNYAALLLVCQYVVMAINISAKEIFHIPVKDLFRSVQTFCFEEISSAFKTRLIVVDNCTNLFSANLNVHVFFDEEKEASTLPASPNCTILTLSTLEPDDHACDEFVAITAKNEAAHSAAAEVEETQYNHELAHDTVVLMVDQEFPLIGYRLNTLRPLSLKPNIADAISI